MKTYKKLFSVSTVLLMAATMGNAYADESEATQLRTQERERTEFNLQTPTADFGQARDREQNMVMQENQYKNLDSSPAARNASGEGSMNRYNTMNRYMQGSATSGSVDRTTTGNRSMDGGRR